MITYKELADTFFHPAMIAKSGINHGVDVIDPDGFDAAMDELEAEDRELWQKIVAFMATAERPLKAGHYFPATGSPGEWYNWTAERRDGLRWAS